MGSYVPSGQAYATRAQLYGVIAAAALTHPSTSTSVQDDKLLQWSEHVDGYLRDQFELPLAKWGSDIVNAVCHLTAYDLVCLRGFNPELDGHYLTNHDRVVTWLR